MSTQRFLEKMAASVGAPPPRSLPKQLTMAEAAIATAFAKPLHRRPALALDEARFLTHGVVVDGSFAAQELGLEYTPASRYIPGLARDYVKALERFE